MPLQYLRRQKYLFTFIVSLYKLTFSGGWGGGGWRGGTVVSPNGAFEPSAKPSLGHKYTVVLQLNSQSLTGEIKLTPAQGCRTGLPAQVPRWAGQLQSTIEYPKSTIYIPRSGTMNLAILNARQNRNSGTVFCQKQHPGLLQFMVRKQYTATCTLQDYNNAAIHSIETRKFNKFNNQYYHVFWPPVEHYVN